MKFIRIACLALIGLYTLPTQAQNYGKCATDFLEEQLINENPAYENRLLQAQEIIQKQIAENKTKQGKTAGVVYTIPVVVHVIYKDYIDNISRAQIEDALRVLNEDFRRLNSDASNTRAVFQGVAADVEVEFKLAKIDPNGNCTDGINRIQSNLAVDAADNVKSLSIWPNDDYMNIWTVRSINVNQSVPGIVLGYAYRPTPNQPGVRDGLVMRHDRMGSIGTAAGVSIGRTLTHEVGHYLGLLHPFSNSCSGGDGISDTPPVDAPNFGCNFNANSCSNDNPDLPDMIENYMDYADDNCTNLFTDGQAAVMRASLTSASLRANLRSASNLNNTGINNPPACTPTADFSADRDFLCAGTAINFLDQSEDGDPDTYAWSFPGGTPATSSAKNPAVTYGNAGFYDVTLTVSNSAGSNTITKAQTVEVKPDFSNFYPTWQQDFEAATVPIPEISIIDAGDGQTFELFTTAGSSGSQSLKLANFNTTVDNEVDAVVSPPIITTFTENLNLDFDHAFARKDISNTDMLSVFASTDCGETWNLVRFYRGTQLETAPLNSNSEFTPSASEWQTKTLNFSGYESPNPILIKFEFEAGGGNNFYLDNIRFSGTIGLEENKVFKQFEVYPNPSNGKFSASFETGGKETLTLELMSFDGKLLDTREKEVAKSATVTYNLGLPSGVYILKVTSNGNFETKKIVVE